MIGIAGILLNATCASYSPNENWLTFFIYLSMAMVMVGYVPHIKSFQYHRMATVAMTGSLAMYVGWVTIIAMGAD